MRWRHTRSRIPATMSAPPVGQAPARGDHRRLYPLIVRTVSLEAQEEADHAEIDRRRIRHKTYASFQLPIEDRIVVHDAMEKLSLMQRRVLYYLFLRRPHAAGNGETHRHLTATRLSRARQVPHQAPGAAQRQLTQ